MPRLQWVYRAAPIRVIDGDSIVVMIDVGFGLWLVRGNKGAHLRLLGVDTPERNEPGWDEARLFAEAWIAAAGDGPWPLVVQTELADNFGRYLALLWRRTDGACLNDDLLAAGLAVPYQKG